MAFLFVRRTAGVLGVAILVGAGSATADLRRSYHGVEKAKIQYRQAIRSFPGKPTASDYSRMKKETVGPAKAAFDKERSAFIKKAAEKAIKHRYERNGQLKKEFIARWIKKVVNAVKGDPKKLAALKVSGAPGGAPGEDPAKAAADRAARKNVTVDGSGFPKEMEFQKPQSEEERLRKLMEEDDAKGAVEEGIHGQ